MGAARRIVIKVGTSTLSDPSGRLQPERMEALVGQIAAIAGTGWAPVLVSSGAIAAGTARLGWSGRPRSLADKQAAAAVGQGLLMGEYERLFAAHQRLVAQVLLTRDDLRARSRYLNSRATLQALLTHGVIPIVNENDTVAVDEIRFGDNDTLSALVASLIAAERFVILSDIDGLYDADPRQTAGARLLPVVEALTPELEAAAGGGGPLGTGGMATKLQAAKIAMRAGIELIIARGDLPDVLARIHAGEPIGTRFVPQAAAPAGRKRWIAFAEQPHGRLIIDDGARTALLSGGKSLLPIGVVGVDGAFAAGALVCIVDRDGRELARGLVNYAAAEIEAAKGLRGAELKQRYGPQAAVEIVHRDNLALS
ncbi:MAG TPA: glutamate 5-kinase [Limnochordia bacterium]|nr:glutamate 5-kinase [Limnochordia bacterium]